MIDAIVESYPPRGRVFLREIIAGIAGYLFAYARELKSTGKWFKSPGKQLEANAPANYRNGNLPKHPSQLGGEMPHGTRELHV